MTLVFSPARVRAARGDMSQRALAVACGITPQMVSALERGKVRPTVDTLAKLASATGREVGYFYVDNGGDGNE